jgi:hypothetical protein
MILTPLVATFGSELEASGMKRSLTRLLFAVLIAAGFGQAAYAYDPSNRAEYEAKIKEARKVFDDRCKNVAGVKIYRTVPEVEGVLLLKVRSERTDRELTDRMWPGAALGREGGGDNYIRSFLGYEHPGAGPIDLIHRGYINTDKRPGSLPGYRWVEVIDPKDGWRYRYSGSVKIVGKKDPTAYNVQLELKRDPNYDMNIYRWSLDKTPSPSKALPRYAVTFEDHLIPEERALWLASSTIKVLDLKTDEVLGEMTRYVMTHIHRSGGGVPWLNVKPCPMTTGDAHAETRQFVDQILIPKREK